MSPCSHEADDGAGERGAEPQHPPRQHAAAVRGRAQQDGGQAGQREAGAAAAEEEGGTAGPGIFSLHQPGWPALL